MTPPDGPFFPRRLLGMVVLIIGLWLLWRLATIWLLIFGSVLVAIILRSLANPIERHFAWSKRWSIGAAVVLIVLAMAFLVWLAGNTLGGQINELSQRIPQAWGSVRTSLQGSPLGSRIAGWIEHASPGAEVISGLSKITFGTIISAIDAVLVIFGGVYLAARPRFYLDGVLLLFPPESRQAAAATALDCARALGLWLKGQVVAMLIIGTLITLGLWLIHLPSALALGVISGLAEFIPVAGLFFAMALSIIVALAQSGEMALWTLGVYAVVQQLESNAIMPLVQQHMVMLPPALMLFSLLAFGALLGSLGLLFAAPLTVVAYVLVKKLYLRDAMGEDTQLPGEANRT